MPDYPDPLVPPLRGGGDRSRDRPVDGVELVVRCNLFGDGSTIVLEHDEVPEDVEYPSLLENSRDEGFKLDGTLRSNVRSVRCSPGHVPLSIRCEATHPRLDSVGDHEEFVSVEQR